MPQPKKLIEVAIPIKEISAESVRDKSIRHGHISTLHLWWARRPLPVCRAVVFASLVPDPLDANCPQQFRDAVSILLGRENNPGDPYKPYDDIPYTSAFDPMVDNLRNRLQMFIGKFSEIYIRNEKGGKSTSSKDMISPACLIKWESKNNDSIIAKARKLIFVAYQAGLGSASSAPELLAEFDTLYGAIKRAEANLYNTPNRHIPSAEVTQKEETLNVAKEAFLAEMPSVFDPFAGGGAIPLEAARLGCRSFGNDINPVAHIIQKGSVEFPQKYGKPITYTKEAFIKRYGVEYFNTLDNQYKVIANGEVTAIKIPNRLSFDVEFYAKKLLAETEKEVGHLYSADEKGSKPIAYYWARVATCSNPSCKAEVPLLKGFYLANTKNKQVYLNPVINGSSIDFEIKTGNCDVEGWMSRGNLTCPCCGNTTDVKTLKEQFTSNNTSERLLAVICDSSDGKLYRTPSPQEIDSVLYINKPENAPNEQMPITYTQALPSCTWGLERWGDMFTNRQLTTLNALVNNFSKLKDELDVNSEYGKAVATYLGILLDRGSAISTSFGRWDVSRENVQTPFSKQAIPMIFDFPESNLLGNTTGSLLNHLDWIIRYLDSESSNSINATVYNSSSGDKSQFDEKFLTTVVTDPPYYDAIAYADLSDFFYVWLKRTLGDIYQLNFSTPQTPKTDECTALKHHHNNSKDKAKKHFEQKLTEIFDAIEHQTSDIVSIMFAHQSTEAWTTLCNSILGARMNITGSWPIDTEMANRSLGLAGSVLASSVTVSAKPSIQEGYGSYRDVKRAIDSTVSKEVEELYKLGFRGADLLTACFGQAVSEFGKYKKVEKADGSEVSVADLLEMAKESAFNALVKGFDGDDFTKFYIGWLQLYAFTESEFDDVTKFTKVGLNIETNDLFAHDLLVKSKNRQTLATYAERVKANKNLGSSSASLLIDKAHRIMALYKGTDRNVLLQYVSDNADTADSNVWRVITSLCELLPPDTDDYKQAMGLNTQRETLIKECRKTQPMAGKMDSLF